MFPHRYTSLLALALVACSPTSPPQPASPTPSATTTGQKAVPAVEEEPTPDKDKDTKAPTGPALEPLPKAAARFAPLFAPDAVFEVEVRSSSVTHGDEPSLREHKIDCRVKEVAQMGEVRVSTVSCDEVESSDAAASVVNLTFSGSYAITADAFHPLDGKPPATSEELSKWVAANRTSMPMELGKIERKWEEEMEISCEVKVDQGARLKSKGAPGAAWCLEELCDGPHTTVHAWCFDEAGPVWVHQENHGGTSYEVSMKVKAAR